MAVIILRIKFKIRSLDEIHQHRRRTLCEGLALGVVALLGYGVVVFAGVSAATILTLFVVPTAYMALARRTTSPEALAKQLDAQQTEHPMK